jgi:AraC-like DNA-binding protein
MQTVEAMQVIQFLERCAGLGMNAVALRESAGLSPAQLADPDDRVPWDAFLRLVSAAERLSGDRLIALRAGLAQRPHGLLIYQFRAQETFKEALTQFCRNVRLAADSLRAEVREGTRDAWLCFTLDEPESDAVCAVREYVAGFWIRFLQEALRSFVPREVRFTHAPRAALGEYGRLVEAPIRFRQSDCAIGIAPDLLAAPLETANPIIARMLADQIERRLAVRRAGEFCASVERSMEGLLREERAIARKSVARRLGVSVRTLQRRLEAESITFRAVREDVLQRAATALLARPALSLDEVAQRTGFADEDAFAKAWKRWTGMTPSEARHRGAEAAEVSRRVERLPRPRSPKA